MRDWPRYITVLKARRQGLTLKEAGQLVGVSHERARQMQRTAIRHLQKWPELLPATEKEGKILKRWTELRALRP